LLQAEREQKILQVVQTIPTTTEGVFATPVDWQYLSKEIMDNKIKPWVVTSFTKFFGQPHDDMVNFVVEMIKAQQPPATLASELRPILDDETDTFMLKLWRMIIFETRFVQQS